MTNDPPMGDLDICGICDGSPHVVGCPEHEDYDDARVAYARADDRADAGTASYWVDETFAAAARDVGLFEEFALREGVAEFTAALRRREIVRL